MHVDCPVTGSFTDSHAHLDFPDYATDLAEVMARARAAGVHCVHTIATRLTQAGMLRDLHRQYPDQVVCSLGIHPHYAADAADAGVTADTLVTACRALMEPEDGVTPALVAIGETGLDLYYGHSDQARQETIFRAHIRAARQLDRPIVVHTRDAEEATRTILEEEQAHQCGGVIHCFTGSEAMARWAVDKGFYLSFSGILTFKNSAPLRDIAAWIPEERLLVETDAPYLAPVPYRGKRNEPAHVVEVAAMLATIRQYSREQMGAITTANFNRLFRPARPTDTVHTETLAYAIGRGLYLNVTRGCTLHCHFCPKWATPRIRDYDLTLRHNPTAEELIRAMGDITPYDEIVFCGYGEPTLRLEVVLQVAAAIKQRGKRTRLNTDGLANLVHGTDVTPRFRGVIDAVSISLNAQDAVTYERHCAPARDGAYMAMLDFIRAVRHHVPDVTATAIDGLPGVDIEACRRIAGQLGVKFRARALDQLA
jgi:TatD DNase family protein